MIDIKDIKQNVFSNNDEDFDYYNQPYEFIEDNELSVGDIFYAGMKQELKPSQFFDVDTLIEQLHESAYCDYGEIAEDYLFDLSKGKRKELENKISEILDKVLPTPNCYNVIDTREYRIVKIDDDNVFVVELEEIKCL